MKKWLLLLMVLLGLIVPALAYTVSGHVYYKGTTIPVPNATLRLSESGGASSTGSTDAFGSFSMGWKDSDLTDRGMVLTASSGFYWGRENWTVEKNTESKDVEVSLCIQLDPSLSLVTMPFHATGAGVTTVVNPAVIQANNNPVLIQNAQINIVFNPAMNVVNVVPIMPGATLIWNSPPGSGVLDVQVEIMPEKHLEPDFPAESFFDVFFEIDLPDSGAMAAPVTVTEALFNSGTPIEMCAVPGTTLNLLGEPDLCNPHFLIDDTMQWLKPLEAEWPQVNISPMTPAEWNDPQWGYMRQWSDYLVEGEPYPPTEFLPSELYVYEGGGSGGTDPEDAGLVMKWGDENTPSGDYASAWKYDYGMDPDLSNSTISITVTAPQFGAAGQINAVSFGIQDVNGNVRSWWWSCGPAGPIAWNTPTTVTIDTSQVGLGAANPPATGFTSNPAFNLTMSQFFIVDENFQWVFGQVPVPPPGQTQFVGMWNYWHNLTVTPNLPGGGANSKWFVKYSQPPEEIEKGLINGWDEVSIYDAQTNFPIMADDWECTDERPVTDIHWWGSFKGWTQPHLPPILPSGFHIGIWTDVPAGVDKPYSHPGQLIWENRCTSWIWNFAGYDRDPRIDAVEWQENEACWQFAQFLSQDQWFRQTPMADGTPNIYWLSIAAIYPPGTDYAGPGFYPWGWKTRPHFFNDDAIRITGAMLWPPAVGAVWAAGDPVEYPAGISWDLAYELTTNEPAYADNPIPGDIGGPSGPGPDGKVDLNDFVIMAENWLLTAPTP